MKHTPSTFTQPDKQRRGFACGLLTAGLMLAASMLPIPAPAQSPFPEKPIRFVMPFPPAGAADNIGRLYSNTISELAGQSVFVDNRPGGNGVIGVQNVLRSPRDGYSVLIGSSSTLAFNAALYKDPPYDPRSDFIPVAMLATLPTVLVTRAESPYQNFNDFVAAAKAKPGAINYGTGSTAIQLSAAWMNSIAGIEVTNIPFKGAGETSPAVLAGTVDVALMDFSAASELIRAGRFRGLALGASQRLGNFPDIPTTAELGLDPYSGDMWVIAAVPAGTPPAIVDYYAQLFAKAGQRPQIQEWLRGRDLGYKSLSVPQLQEQIASEVKRWRGLVKELSVPQL